MSSEEPIRSVPDELFRKVSAKPERQLPDALFGPPPAPREPEATSDGASGTAVENGGGSESADESDAEDDGSGDIVTGAQPQANVVGDTSSGGAGNDASEPIADSAEALGESVSSSAKVSPATLSTADEPAETREAARPVLLVIADSLSYFGPKGGLPADHPRIWPNLVAAELDWDVELVARIGWTCRDAYWALIGDPRVWAAVPRAGAVVFAVGGMDTLPSPLPTALRELIRYVRPPALRRVVRATYNWLQPKLSKLGRPVALPPKVSVDYLEQCRTALAQLRPDLPVVAVLPSVHNCAAYGRVHSGRPRAVEALRAWSGRTSVPLVDLGEAVRDNIFSGEANPDGIHWGWDGHTAVANAMVKTLQEVR